jgi:Ser/Thr protein kinase RdoA (MazF antagonist)
MAVDGGGTGQAPNFPALVTLRALLAEQYGVGEPARITLRLLREHPRKRIYLVERAAGDADAAEAPLPRLPWVLRLYGAGRPTTGLEAQARVLQLLERRSYPAPRVVKAMDGVAVSAFDAETGRHPVLVTTYVAGEPTRFALPSLRAHGGMVGRLHALMPLLPGMPEMATDDHAASGEPDGIRPAGMLPDGEIAASLSWLDGVRGQMPAALRRQYEAMEAACHGLYRFPDTPRVLIHNDCHHWNSVATPDGRVVLIDWEGAGLGPAVIDLGFAALSVDTGGIVGQIVPADPARLDALLAGYRQQHALTSGELEHLADAIRFRTLVGACANLAHAVRDGKPEAIEPWWWQRCEMAEKIADRVRVGLGV